MSFANVPVYTYPDANKNKPWMRISQDARVTLLASIPQSEWYIGEITFRSGATAGKKAKGFIYGPDVPQAPLGFPNPPFAKNWGELPAACVP